MKTIILAGGLGTRLSEETSQKPKPMVLLDNMPIIWHIMSIFAHQGFDDFVIAGGYKISIIEGWVQELDTDWKIQVINTGETNQTASRIFQCMKKIGHQRVFVTYGDGLANVNLSKLVQVHEKNRKLATLTAVRPPARFGVLETNGEIVTHFGEKNQTDAGWINGGFFLLEPELANLKYSDSTSFESNVMPWLVENRTLAANHHHGFWMPMDTLRERNVLADLSRLRPPPWLQD